MVSEERIYRKLRRCTEETRSTLRRYRTHERASLFFLRPDEKTRYVQHRLQEMQPRFLELLGLRAFESASHVSNEPFYTYGMVVNISGSRLCKDTVYIMNCIDISNSVLVRLNLEYLQGYSVYPGQVVAVKGRNSAGNELVVEEIECMSLLDINNTDSSSFSHIYARKPLEIITASGPFSDTKQSFTALETLLGKASDILILHGPFALSGTDAGGRDPVAVLQQEVLSRIEAWLRRSATSRAILVPSLDDAVSLRLLPQIPYTFDCIDSNRILFLSNPSMFFINELLFATSSTDLLLSLISEECFCTSQNAVSRSTELLFAGDRIDRICRHLVFQRTFLPVFPAMHPVSLADPTVFDMEITPDIFVISSKVRSFVKEITPTTVVNHGVQHKVENKVYARILVGGSRMRHTATLHRLSNDETLS